MNEEQQSISINHQEIIKNGLWKNNSALVQALGLCPLLAISTSVVNALGLGLATLWVLTLSNIIVSLMRQHISEAIRLPALLIIIASLVSCIELLMRAYTYELYQVLGIFIPLIVVNGAVLYRAEDFARKNKIISAALDGFMMGLGFTLVIVCVGAAREILGTGAIFNNMQLLFGDSAADWKLNVLSDAYPGIILALLPPGAFIMVGFLMAVKNAIDIHTKEKINVSKINLVKGAKRVRTTGPVS